MHAERDIVLEILSVRDPSVCLSNAGIVSKRMNTASHFLTLLQGHRSSFLSPNIVTNFQGEPRQRAWGRVKYTGSGRI